MAELFQNVLDISIQGGVLIAVVCLLRLGLRKAPKGLTCMLWLLVGLRLLVPFEIQSNFSLQPEVAQITQFRAEEGKVTEPIPVVPAVPENADTPEDVEVAVQNAVQETESPAPVKTAQSLVIDWNEILGWVWLTAAFGLGLYSILSYRKLKRRVGNSVILAEGVWVCPGLDTAFVLGWFRPQIYLPAELSPQEREFVLAHEQCHIRRFDHWWKLVGFLALALHWFNPLVWLAYGLLCRDLEMACDEAVVRSMDLGQRKAYSTALLACSSGHRFLAACPVAFGEVSVRERIKSVMNYKKPKFWIILAAVAALVITAVCFLTSPEKGEFVSAEDIAGNTYTYEKDGFGSDFTITLEEDGTFTYYEGALSSYIGMGTWTLEEDTLRLRDEGLSALKYFYFRAEDGFLTFQEEKSAAFMHVTVSDGEKFLLTRDEEEVEQKLAQCREALSEWQSQESYHLLRENQHSGETLDDYTRQEFWVSGEDWLNIVTMPETDNGVEWSHLRKDGVEYEQYLYQMNIEEPEGWTWAVAEESSGSMDSAWPMYFQWEDGSVAYKYSGVAEGKESIVLSVTDNTSTYSESSPYTVQFCFDEAGGLESIVLTLVTNNGDGRWYRDQTTVATFTLVSTNTAQINQTIEAAYGECMAAQGGNLLYPMVEHPDPVEDWGVEFMLDRGTLTRAGVSVWFALKRGSDLVVHTDAEFWLEKKTEDGWESVPALKSAVDWGNATYMLSDAIYATLPVDWTQLYGHLNSGTYRIGKNFTNRDNLETCPVYAEFEIYYNESTTAEQEAAVERCYAAVEALRSRDTYHFVYHDCDGDTTEVWYSNGNYLRQRIYDAGVLGGADRFYGEILYNGVGYSMLHEDPEDDTSPAAGWEMRSLSEAANRVGWVLNLNIDAGLSHFERMNSLIEFPEGKSRISEEEITFWESWEADGVVVRRRSTYRFNAKGELYYLEQDSEYLGEDRELTYVEFLDTTPEEVDALIRENLEKTVAGTFSWEEAKEKFTADQYNIRQSGFRNTEPVAITGPEDAARRAMEEYPELNTWLTNRAFYDEETKMWLVSIEGYVDYQSTYEYRDVYMDENGITKLLVYEGPVKDRGLSLAQ